MASISTDKHGRRRVLFTSPVGGRKAIRLGKVSMKQATIACGHVEQLITAIITGTAPNDDTAYWVASRPASFAKKLIAAGLIAGRMETTAEEVTLEPFLDAYFTSRGDVKPLTLLAWRQTRRNLIEYFGAGKALRPIDYRRRWRRVSPLVDYPRELGRQHRTTPLRHREAILPRSRAKGADR
jgi:hypothetical protein